MKAKTSTTPMTRAQKFQWYLENGLVERVSSLPAAMSVASVRCLVHELERRFEILRTSIDMVAGELRQKLHVSGSPLVVVELAGESDVEQCMATLVGDFKMNRRARIGRLLVQFFLLRGQDQQWLALVADNVAVDASFHSVLDDEIARILAGCTDLPDGLQPRAAAALEASPKGKLERAEAAAYLRRHFAVAPPRLHPVRPSSGRNEARFYRSTLQLEGADHLLSRVISSTGLLPSVLILTAFAQLMCWRSECDSCSVNVSVINRHNDELRRVLCATAQRAPVALPVQDGALLAAAASVQRTLSQDHPAYGRYDPFDLLAERGRAQRYRGVCLTTDLAFNFMPPPRGWSALIESDGGGAPHGSGHCSEIAWVTTDEVSYEYAASLSVRWNDSRSARLSLHGDSDVITPSQCAALLRGVELMLKRAAAGQDCTADEAAGEVGLHRLYRPTYEQQVNGRWIDSEAIRGRLLAMDGVDTAEVFVDQHGDSGDSRLVVRVATAGGSAVTPTDLHEELLKAVEAGALLVAPHRYEVIGGSQIQSSELIWTS
jgi:hypothetical protein